MNQDSVFCRAVDSEVRRASCMFDKLYYLLTVARGDGSMKDVDIANVLSFLDGLKKLWEDKYLNEEMDELGVKK